MTNFIKVINSFLSPLEKWITSNRVWISRILLVVAFLPLLLLFTSQPFKDSGSIAFTILFAILILSPLSRITWISLLTKLMPFRKELWIMMGMFAIVHTGWFYIINSANFSSLFATKITQAWFLAGFIALIFTLALTVTSNIWSMKFLGKNWKHLHRLAYVIFVLTIVHVIALGAMKGHIDYWMILSGIIWFILKVLDMSSVRLVKD